MHSQSCHINSHRNHRGDLYTQTESIATISLLDFSPVVVNEYSKQINVHKNTSEDLAGYILRITSEQNISFNEVERRADRKGCKITQSYISKMVSGAAQNISVEKLQALAAGLNRPEEEVFRVARGGDTADKIDDAAASAMLFKYTQLNDEAKKELANLIKIVDREIDEKLQKQGKDKK